MEIVGKTKILFIVSQSEFGGAQRFILELVSHLNKEKYEVLVAAGQGDGELFKKLQNLNIKTVQLKHLKRTPYPLKAFFSVLEMLELLKKERPNVFFLCSTTAGILGSIASSIYHTHNSSFKVVYRIGGWAFNDPRNWFLNKLIILAEKLTAGFKNKIIINSEADYQAAIKNKICSSNKIIKIYNGINAEKLEFLPKNEAQKFLSEKTGKPLNADFLIGCVANFYNTKGIIYLIKSIDLLETKYKPLGAKCIIIGDGKQRPEIENLIKKHKLENKVFLAGRIPDAYKYLKAFDVFVLPSLKEGFPWIILETMAAEIPIIATNIGALPEIIENNEQGILIDPKNPAQIAEKIQKLIENPESAQRLQKQAKHKLKQFSLLKMVQKIEQLFN